MSNLFVLWYFSLILSKILNRVVKNVTTHAVTQGQQQKEKPLMARQMQSLLHGQLGCKADKPQPKS